MTQESEEGATPMPSTTDQRANEHLAVLRRQVATLEAQRRQLSERIQALQQELGVASSTLMAVRGGIFALELALGVAPAENEQASAG